MATTASASGNEDAASIPITLTGTDVDGTIASVTLTSLPANGTLYTDAGLTTLAAISTPYAGTSHTFYFVPNANFNGAPTFQFTVTDNQAAYDATQATATITVNSVDDAPVNTVPGAQTGTEDTPLTFNAAHSNLITIGDVDAGGADVQTIISVDSGTLHWATNAGLTTATGDNTGAITLVGSVSEINAAINGLVYTPDGDFNGSDVLHITTNDKGNTGAGGPLSDPDTVNITINAVNDAPVNSVPGIQAVDDDQTLTFDAGHGNKISISDVDAGTDNVQVTLSVDAGGALHVDDVGTLITAGNNDSDTITLTGSLTEINSELDGLVYTPFASLTGDTLHIDTDDLAHNRGGSLKDASTVTITVNAHQTGDAGADILVGGAGNDTIDGKAGTDTITGGGGNDLLTGGSEGDAFHYASASEGVDTITDFQIGSGADHDALDIKDLLVGFGGGSDINDFVHLTVSAGNTTVSVDANGTVGGSSFVNLATLSGVDVGSSTAQNLVDDGNLIVN